MAKISLPDNLLSSLASSFGGARAEKKRETEKAKAFKASFKEAAAQGLSATEPENAADESALLYTVHESGSALKQDPNPENIQRYKAAVRHFIHYVVDKTYTVTEKESGGSILKRKKFTNLVVIDEKLERLAAAIMGSQKDKLEILRKVDEINGLLVDMLR